MLYENLSVNENGRLCFAGRDVCGLAEKYGTPLMIMDESKIRANCRVYTEAMKKHMPEGSHPLFASKALSFKKIYGIMREEGMGIDIVSPGELYTAVAGGYPVGNGYFHGNNKTPADIAYAIDSGVGYFVADHTDELDDINAYAATKGIRQKVLLRITPGIDPHTHKAISTGNVDSKFGQAIATGQADEFVAHALSLDNIELCGYHCHIGSQIFESDPFICAVYIMLKFISDMKDKHGYEAKQLNLGGGFAVRYTEDDPSIDIEKNISDIGKIVFDKSAELGITPPMILMEPGRSIVADAGMTVYTVGSVKEITGFRSYVSIDGGMPDNPRYALYQSVYTVINASRANAEADYECTVAGRCCESGDLIGEGMKLAKPVKGEYLAVLTTGAYNYAMASNYNRIPRPPIVMLTPEGEYVAVRREEYKDLIEYDM
ncbi:MAG: diaminopimelate decarboxylase [Clostridia bacterium]|nr:diaminopimelate decarboxylase [Clostridia bacterium]